MLGMDRAADNNNGDLGTEQADLLAMLLAPIVKQLHHLITETLLHALDHIVGAVILRLRSEAVSVIKCDRVVRLLVIGLILILLNIRMWLGILVILLLLVTILLWMLNVILLLLPRLQIMHRLLRVCDLGYLGDIGDVGRGLGLGAGRVAQMVAEDWDGDGLHNWPRIPRAPDPHRPHTPQPRRPRLALCLLKGQGARLNLTPRAVALLLHQPVMSRALLLEPRVGAAAHMR